MAYIEMPFGHEPPKIFCPVCGKAIFTEDEIVPCKHLLFVHSSDCGEFLYTRSDVADLVQVIEQTEPSGQGRPEKSLPETVFERLRKPAAFALEIVYGGMACGPVWFTDHVAFDFE